MSNLCQQLAPLTNFWSECSPDPMCPGLEIQVSVGTAASAAVENPADFEVGDTTLVAKPVQPVHVSKSFHVTAAQYEQCFRLEKLASINSDLFGQAIWNKVLPLLTATNYPAEVLDTVATWGPDSLKKVYAALKGPTKHLILDPSLFASVMFTTTGGCCFPLTQDSGPGAYGFQSINEMTYWATAPAGTLGFAWNPTAVIFASGVPPTIPQCGSMIESRAFTVPGTGLTAQFNLWCSTKTRSLWGSYDVIVGAAPGTACAVRIVPAAAGTTSEEINRMEAEAALKAARLDYEHQVAVAKAAQADKVSSREFAEAKLASAQARLQAAQEQEKVVAAQLKAAQEAQAKAASQTQAHPQSKVR